MRTLEHFNPVLINEYLTSYLGAISVVAALVECEEKGGFSQIDALLTRCAMMPHYPSKLAREGGIRNLISCHGIEDRGDGDGGFSLASKELMEYAIAMRG